MASLTPLLPTPPASIKMRDMDAVESRSPKRHRPLEPEASGSLRREPNSPPSSRLRAGRSPPSPPSPSTARPQSRSPPPSRVRRRSRSPPPSRVRRQSRSPSPSRVRRRSRSPSRVRRRSRSPSPSRVRRQSRSPSPSRVRRRSRSPSPSKVQRRSRSPSPSRLRRRSRSPSPSRLRRRSRSTSRVWRRSRSPSPSRVQRRSRSPSPSRVRRRSRSLSPSRVRHRSRSPSRVRRRSRSSSPSRVRRRSRPPSSSRVRRRSRSPPPSRFRRRSRSRSPSRVRRRSRSRSTSRVRRRSRSRSTSKVRRRSRSLSPSRVRRRSRSRSPSLSKVRRRSRSPPCVSRPAEVQHAKRPSVEADIEGETASPSSTDESLMKNRPSYSRSNCQVPSRNARRKKMKRQRWAEAKKQMSKAPSTNGRRRKREIWAEAKKEFREMKKDKLLENIKKLQACVWLLEKDGADMAEIMEFRSLLESVKKQYAENEAQLAKEGSSAPLQVLKRDRLEKTHVETIATPVEKAERDEQNMDSGKVEGSDNEVAEEVNHLKSELETVKQDRDYQLAQTQSLMADVAKQKEVARRYGVELEDAMRRVAALEEGCLLRRETINVLQNQLASANEKLTVPSPT